MLRTKLLTAAAATALLAAPAAFAQDTTTRQMPPAEQPAPTPMLAPQATPAPAAQAAPAPAAAAPAVQANNVIDVLTAQGNFTTLLAALDSAGLTDTLKSRPAVSIFAPTDEAFAALPEAERTRLMDPANAAELRSLLLYHVIVADVSSSQIQGARGGVETAGRTQVLLDGTGESLKIDGATITRADIDASNGAVFAIDKVLNPAQSMAAMGDEETAAPAAPATTAAPAAEAPAATDAAPAEGAVPPLPATEAPSPVAPPSPATATPPPPVPNATGITETVRPASPGSTAPNGQPSAMTTTVQSPPVPNPTDGQVDDEEDEANPAPTPAPAPRPAPAPTPN
ncbi:hypothetical protein GCM10009422_00030 [Brevundimonas kwangchunensis]|uniref:FAS1 domain-containing protein n=1 Tax=Brevundimonas kwangchunensis TaxID=322163 RepID=A0ABN1GE00_9CAUL